MICEAKEKSVKEQIDDSVKGIGCLLWIVIIIFGYYVYHLQKDVENIKAELSTAQFIPQR